MTTRFSPALAALLFTASGCSPDLSLLDDQTSFAGAPDLSDPSPSAGSANGGVGGSTSGGGGNASIASNGGKPNGGDGGNSTPHDGGAGGAPSPAPCVVTGAEVCNAKDDDCNGIVDDGCPGGVTTTFDRDLQLLGDSSGGVAFTDDCNDGEVLSGVQVRMGAFLSQITATCRPLALELNHAAEHGYAVTLGAERALEQHPTSSSDTVTKLACPANEALVGMRLAQQHYTLEDQSVVPVISRVWISCARLLLVEQTTKLTVAWVGAKELAPASGSIADGTAWLVQADAPDGLVASRLLGAAGSWVDKVSFGVSRLDVVIR